MPYLIDGHNLIAHLPNLRLSDPDDEANLARGLLLFCQRTHSQAVVYFDRGQPAAERPGSRAGLTVRFVPPPRTADQAILAHLARLGKEARNWTVVSSDAELLASAARFGARLLTSPQFARRLLTRASAAEKPEAPTDPEEISSWEARFQGRKASTRS